MKESKYWRTLHKMLENRATLMESIQTAKSYPCVVGQRCLNSSISINEGLIKTYPTYRTIDFVSEQLRKQNLAWVKYYINDYRGELGKQYQIADSITVVFDGYEFTQKHYNETERLFNACGYYIACFYWTEGKSEAVIQFEPKFRDNSFNPKQISRYLYHVTTERRFEKINKVGFIPKSRNSKFNYPPRCYFFTEYDEPFFKNFIRASRDIGKEKIIVLVVDRDKLNSEIKFWEDQAFVGEDIAVYTYENIPTSAIIDYKEI